MVRVVEIAADLWIFSLPVVAMVWALLRIFDRARPRARYALVVGAFVTALVLVFTPARTRPAWSGGPESFAAGPSWRTVAAQRASVPLAIIWGAGALLLLGRDAAGHLKLRLARTRWSSATGSMRDELQWPEQVPLATAETIFPLTAGLIRPVVVLPTSLLETHSRSIARRIARHELSHALWRDPLVLAVMRAVSYTLWIAPLWPLLRWARREREAAADAFALRGSTDDHHGYVLALLQIAREVPPAAVAMAGNDLEYRARRILERQPRRPILLAMIVLVSASVFAWTAGHAELTWREPAVRPAEVMTSRLAKTFEPPPERRAISIPRAAEESLPPSKSVHLSLTPGSSPRDPSSEPLPHSNSPHVNISRHADVSRHSHQETTQSPPPDDDRVVVIRNVIRKR